MRERNTEVNISLSVGRIPMHGLRRLLHNTELVEDSLRRLAPLKHRSHDEIGSAHHVAAGKHTRVGGLKSIRLPGRDTHAAVVVQTDRVYREPLGRARQKSES